MEFRSYQEKAEQTDHTPGEGEFRTALQVLALQSKVGELSSNFKKYYRRQKTKTNLQNSISKNLGDILWYISSIATSSKLDLEDVAEENLEKLKRRFGVIEPSLFDPLEARISRLHERFPASMRFTFHSFQDLTNQTVMQVSVFGPSGEPLGDTIDDNEYVEDGYRYHDALHICFMTFIGWSPVMRKLLGIKRKTSEVLDRVEDGAKARDIEEALTKYIFNYIKDNDFLADITEIDSDLIDSIPSMIGDREAAWLSEAQWEIAILTGAKLMRRLMAHKGGLLSCDMKKPNVSFSPLPSLGT